jgi:hypothetical protein
MAIGRSHVGAGGRTPDEPLSARADGHPPAGRQPRTCPFGNISDVARVVRSLGMANDHGLIRETPATQPRARVSRAKRSGQDVAENRGITEGHLVSTERARNEAEQVRRLAEEARETREEDREAVEQVRNDRERLREVGETTRVAGEGARLEAEHVRQAAMVAVHATAETLETTLDQMKVVEDMRRTLREIRDLNKLDSN